MAQGSSVIFVLDDDRELNLNTLSCLLNISDHESILALAIQFMKVRLIDCHLNDEEVQKITEGGNGPLKKEEAFTKLNGIRHNTVAIRNILPDLDAEKKMQVQDLLNGILGATAKLQEFVNIYGAETRQEGTY